MESRETINANEVRSMEAVFGKDDPMFQDAEKPKDLTGNQEVEEDPGYDAAIMADAEKAALEVDRPKKDIPVEVEITHLKNADTGNVFPVNSTIIKQKHLKPCDKNGKLVYDNRIFNRFN